MSGRLAYPAGFDTQLALVVAARIVPGIALQQTLPLQVIETIHTTSTVGNCMHTLTTRIRTLLTSHSQPANSTILDAVVLIVDDEGGWTASAECAIMAAG